MDSDQCMSKGLALSVNLHIQLYEQWKVLNARQKVLPCLLTYTYNCMNNGKCSMHVKRSCLVCKPTHTIVCTMESAQCTSTGLALSVNLHIQLYEQWKVLNARQQVLPCLLTYTYNCMNNGKCSMHVNRSCLVCSNVTRSDKKKTECSFAHSEILIPTESAIKELNLHRPMLRNTQART